jgi:hypothetical protein
MKGLETDNRKVRKAGPQRFAKVLLCVALRGLCVLCGFIPANLD